MIAGATGAAGQALGNIAGDWIGQSISSHFNRKSSKKAVQNALLMMQVQDNIWRNQLRDYHQIESEGLKAAHMNPALTAYNGANPAGVGAGSLNFSPTDNGGLGNLGTEMMSGIRDTKRVDNETTVADATADNQTSQAFENYEKAKTIAPESKQNIAESQSRVAENFASAEELKSKKDLNNAEADLAAEQLETQKIETKLTEIEKEYQSGNYAKVMRYWKDLNENLNGATSAVGKIFGLYMSEKTLQNGKEIGAAILEFKNSNIGKMLFNTHRTRKRR